MSAQENQLMKVLKMQRRSESDSEENGEPNPNLQSPQFSEEEEQKTITFKDSNKKMFSSESEDEQVRVHTKVSEERPDTNWNLFDSSSDDEDIHKYFELPTERKARKQLKATEKDPKRLTGPRRFEKEDPIDPSKYTKRELEQRAYIQKLPEFRPIARGKKLSKPLKEKAQPTKEDNSVQELESHFRDEDTENLVIPEGAIEKPPQNSDSDSEEGNTYKKLLEYPVLAVHGLKINDDGSYMYLTEFEALKIEGEEKPVKDKFVYWVHEDHAKNMQYRIAQFLDRHKRGVIPEVEDEFLMECLPDYKEYLDEKDDPEDAELRKKLLKIIEDTFGPQEDHSDWEW